MRRKLELQHEALDPLALAAWVQDDQTGAVVSFVGRVRDQEGEGFIDALDYEVYPEMALQQMQRLADEIERDYPDVRALALAHRVGVIPVGEAAVAVVVGAGHRQEGFSACRYGIDRLKEIVPIWKRVAKGAARH